MVEFLPFYFFLFVTFPTFQCRYVYQYLSFFISFLRYVIHLLRYTDGSGPSFRIHLFKVFFRFPVSGFHRSMQP